MTQFRRQRLQDQVEVILPVGLDVVEVVKSELELERRHVLISLAWHNSYIYRVPLPYREFFTYALPYLRARTTDVHTATSAGFVPELLEGLPVAINEPVTYAALILHDSGWSSVDEVGIADSLDGRGLRHDDHPADTIEQHDAFGAGIARQVLPESPLAVQLGLDGQQLVADLVGHHTWGERYRPDGRHYLEMDILCDADRLWSYSFENFWQDVIRKRVEVTEYLESISKAIPEYFVTPTARKLAQRLVQKRRSEVGEYEKYRTSTL